MASIQNERFLDSNYTGPRATPTASNGGVLSAFSSFTTKASPSKVHNALLEYQKWPEWNTFVPLCTVTYPSDPNFKLEAGYKLTFKVQMAPDNQTTSKEVVVQADPPPQKPGDIATVRWVAAMAPDVLLKAERVNEIQMNEDGGITYRTWETFAGPVAYLVRWKVGELLQARMQDWSKDLQRYVEGEETEMTGPAAEQTPHV